MSPELSYYPGCTAHGSAREQDLSTRGVCAALGVGLTELDDWSCCGATAAHAVGGGELLLELGARNLRIAEAAGRDLLVPCAACFGNLRAAAHRGAGTKEAILPVTGLLASGDLLETIRLRSEGRLAGLKVVPFYGCLLVRPPEVTGVDDPEDPREMDIVAEATGADVVTWSHKTACCGGGLTVSHPELVAAATAEILQRARAAGADCIVTACPMCHANLDTGQWRQRRSGRKERSDAAETPQPRGEVPAMPVLYLTELVGLALGLHEAPRWLGRHLVDPRPLLGELGVLP